MDDGSALSGAAAAPLIELSATERRAIAAFAEAMPGPVIVVDPAARLIVGNAAARTVLPGVREGNLLAMALRAPDVLDAVRRVASGAPAEEALWNERVPVERVFDVRVAPLAMPRVAAVVIAMTDLTEARRLERMRADFIANASHELRTPLASLLGFIETLQGPARDDAKARGNFLSIMRDQARRMARLIDDLLSLSRIEQTAHLRPQTPVDLVAAVRHVADTLGPMASGAGVSVQLDVPDKAMVAGDRDELIRVIENLIENAIKYGAKPVGPSRVEVTVGDEAAGVQLCVRDEGPGVAPEHLPRLTERFYRIDAPVSRAKGGTGLGLAIVKHIVARHRGSLRIESRLGAGSTFRVVLPRFEPRTPEAR